MAKRKIMLIIKLQGGLGNQMFQYAFASILAKYNKTNVHIDYRFFELTEKKPGFTPRIFELGVFCNKIAKASSSSINSFYFLSKFSKFKKKIGLNYPKIYNELSFEFQPEIQTLKAPVYLNGYFQSYKYLIGHEDFIRKVFSFPVNNLDKINEELLSIIKTSNSIAIHVRRGDYVMDEITSEYHGSCSLNYYNEAINLLASKKNDFTLFFFSDDSEWVKEHFNELPFTKIIIDHNKGDNSWKDMMLMSKCKHNIIANSSFSWWAAWLNTNPLKQIIAPKEWFKTKELNTKTLLPEEWIKL